MQRVAHATFRAFSVATLIALSDCLAAAPFRTKAAATPEVQPEIFFVGITHGVGTMAQRGKAARTFRVEGLGQWDTNTDFRLEQKVFFDDGTRESRTWHLRRESANRYTGTISGASGKVVGETNGNVFHLRYLLRQPAVYMEQRLYLQPDHRTVLNVATVSALGVPWVRLFETITRADTTWSPDRP